MKKISIVVPCYNEQENVGPISEAILAEIKKFPQYDYELIFIDNDSKDGTRRILRGLCAENPKIRAIFNARNFGQFNSPYYGLLQASGDCAILLASDFQEPPELIPQFIAAWEEGYRMVCGVKTRSKENPLMYALRGLYYKMIRKLSEVEQIDQFTGFGLYDRSMIEIMKSLDDPTPFLRGIVAEIGFKHKCIEFTQPKRRAGKTSNNFFRLFDAAMLSFTSYTKAGLRMATYIGMLGSAACLVIAVIYLIMKLVRWDEFSAGTAPILIGMSLLGCVQLFFIGMIGEYIMSISDRVKHRPLVIEEERINFPGQGRRFAGNEISQRKNGNRAEENSRQDRFPAAAKNADPDRRQKPSGEEQGKNRQPQSDAESGKNRQLQNDAEVGKNRPAQNSAETGKNRQPQESAEAGKSRQLQNGAETGKNRQPQGSVETGKNRQPQNGTEAGKSRQPQNGAEAGKSRQPQRNEEAGKNRSYQGGADAEKNRRLLNAEGSEKLRQPQGRNERIQKEESVSAAEKKPFRPAEGKKAEFLTENRVPAQRDRKPEGKQADSKAVEEKTAETKAAEKKTAEMKAAETKAAETKTAEAKTAETKAAEIKPEETKAAEAKAVEEKPAEARASETKTTEPKSADLSQSVTEKIITADSGRNGEEE